MSPVLTLVHQHLITSLEVVVVELTDVVLMKPDTTLLEQATLEMVAVDTVT